VNLESAIDEDLIGYRTILGGHVALVRRLTVLIQHTWLKKTPNIHQKIEK